MEQKESVILQNHKEGKGTHFYMTELWHEKLWLRNALYLNKISVNLQKILNRGFLATSLRAVYVVFIAV